MDSLSQWCFRLRSPRLRFRDCSKVLQTCKLELRAQTECSAGLTSAGGRRVGDVSEGFAPAGVGSGQAGG